MLDWVVEKLESIGGPAGWIVSIIQIPLWIISGLVSVRRGRVIAKKEQELSELREELARIKDYTERCKQVAAHAVAVLRFHQDTHRAYEEFLEDYREEGILPDWLIKKETREG